MLGKGRALVTKKRCGRSLRGVVLASHTHINSAPLSRLCIWNGQQALRVLGGVYLLPLAAHDSLANLRGRSAFMGLFVCVKIFFLADVATCRMAADVTIEQASMPLAAIAVAIAGLLVEDLFNAAGDSVRIGCLRIGKKRSRHCWWQPALRSVRVECRSRLVHSLGALIHALHQAVRGCGELGKRQQADGADCEKATDGQFAEHFHGGLFLSKSRKFPLYGDERRISRRMPQTARSGFTVVKALRCAPAPEWSGPGCGRRSNCRSGCLR